MDLLTALVNKVKPELNHIYTDPPLMTPGGHDLGWYCREHALHIYGVAILLGKKAEICLGDFALMRPGAESFQSISDHSDHAWCCIDAQVPVDVSITVKHIYPDMDDIKIIWADRHDLSPSFEIKYYERAEDEELLVKASASQKPTIFYNEKSRLRYDLQDLLNNPFQFLFKPPLSAPTLPEIYGSDVFHAITYHCYKMVNDEIKPLCRYRDPKNAIGGS